MLMTWPIISQSLTYLFSSKMVEKIASIQLKCYVGANYLLLKQQSGFKRFHSTESVLTRIIYDLSGAIDLGQMTFFALCEVSGHCRQ